SVEDGVPVEPGHVYVIPPGKRLTLEDGALRLSEPPKPHGRRAPIDDFFRSLAADRGERAVCVVLSGTGTDGSVGLKTVKEAGGLTMAQDPADADYDGMPRSAVSTGLVDVVLPASQLGRRLLELRQQGLPLPAEPRALPAEDGEALSRVLALLRAHTGHDFAAYKRPTILRRIGRRMQVRGVQELIDYLALLRGDDGEVQALFRDLLISVTQFFRDPAAFTMLEETVIPKVFEGKGTGDQVRVWVCGCATGEEAYSVAMLLCDHAAVLEEAPAIQVFATDIDVDAIAFAREGLYPGVAAADVPPERLQRYFSAEGDGYRVKDTLRERVLFAVHNVLSDPPFSKLDLATCRNVLIYLQREAQERVFAAFAYALRPNGYLFLGTSESVEGTQDFFRIVAKKQRLFQARGVALDALRPPFLAATTDGDRPGRRRPPSRTNGEDGPGRPPSLGELHTRLLARDFTPPSVLVGERNELLHVAGRVERFLQFPEGEPTTDLLQVVRKELRPDLRTALFHARQKGQATERQHLTLRTEDDELEGVLLTVRRLRKPAEVAGLIQVVFEKAAPVYDAESARADGAGHVEILETELHKTKDRLRATIEEYETSNEELKAS
ncbi:MAG: CheR family methyltransferase, partial [Rhodothermales bacterium]|nr:CheR family methyltransferase [Rhodothermales bacterium]